MQIVAGANLLDITMQLITGTLSGTVKDQSGAALSGVAVAINGTTQTNTAADGTYSVLELPLEPIRLHSARLDILPLHAKD